MQAVRPGASGRVFNFSAGPACLPLEVLEVARVSRLQGREVLEERPETVVLVAQHIQVE